MTFWDHLEELRGVLMRVIIAVVVAGMATFCFKEQLFAVVLAPKSSDFVTYRFFGMVVGELEPFSINLINVNLAQQFMIHMKVALCAGALVVSPYIIYLLFGFIAPALYRAERRYAAMAVVGGYLMFIVGVLFNYFMLFPLTFRFLGTYQVDASVANMISLESYISTLMMLCLVMGGMFELPVLSWLLAKVGILKSALMRRVRRYAIVAILCISAVITPTGDVFTLLMVSAPIYLLYELSIGMVSRVEHRRSASQN